MDINKFYNRFGWKKHNKVFKDAELFEDLRKYSSEYVKKCRLRLNKFIPKKGVNILDFASGPIQYKEYLSYSKNFRYRHCVDFSFDAIKIAKKKIGKKGKYYNKDFKKINFKKNYFDCIISLHTIYHINKKDQKNIIKKLIKIAKKNSTIIIIYSNPNTLLSRIKRLINHKPIKIKNLYFHCYPNSWWDQFKDVADVKILPWRSFSSQHQKIIFPNNIFGMLMFNILFFLEEEFPNFFSKNFQYPMIILKKK